MIDAKQNNIMQLLNEGDNQFKVPKYQRNFVWGEEQALEMLEDIIENHSSIFLGTLVFYKKEDKTLEIVDGQQRLTAIFILLAAVRIRAKELENYNLASDLQSKLTFIDPTTGSNRGARLIATDQIREAFENTVLVYEWQGDFNLPELKNRKRQVNKIKPIFKGFYEHIRKLNADELSHFLRMVYDSTLVRIDINNESEAFEVFERSNARGLELNAADLLKNYLFQNLSKDERYDETEVENDWKIITDYAGSSIIRMLRYYYILKKGHIQKKKLFDGVKNYGNKIGAENLLGELKDFSYIYSCFTNPTKDALKEVLLDENPKEGFQEEYRIDDFRRHLEAFQLFRITQVYSVIIALYYSLLNDVGCSKKTVKEFLSVVQKMENFHFVNNMVAGYPGNKIEHDYAELARMIHNTKNFEQNKKAIEDYLKKNIESKDQFMGYFKDLSYDKFVLIYYIFDRFNNFDLRGGEKVDIYNTDTRLLKKNFSVEHIKPKSDFNSEDEEEVEVRDNIGNLLIVPMHMNSSLGNKPFNEKREMLQQVQHLSVVDQFMKEYGTKEEFGESDIKERANSLAEEAYDRIWNIQG